MFIRYGLRTVNESLIDVDQLASVIALQSAQRWAAGMLPRTTSGGGGSIVRIIQFSTNDRGPPRPHFDIRTLD